jgi:hypothetical protein
MARRPNLYQAAAWKNPVAQGVSDTWFVELHGYAKRSSAELPYSVPNEYVASRIGQVLGLPVPPGAVIETPIEEQGKAWLTLNFAPKTELLPPIDPAITVAAVPDLAAGVVAFDLFIANTDRHVGNLAFLPSQKRLDIFDHGHALLGIRLGRVQNRLDELRGQTGLSGAAVDGIPSNRHCLIDHITSATTLIGWSEEIQRIVGDRFLGRVCEEAAALDAGASPEEMMRAEQFLGERRDSLKRILFDHRTEFTRIEEGDWGMEL